MQASRVLTQADFPDSLARLHRRGRVQPLYSAHPLPERSVVAAGYSLGSSEPGFGSEAICISSVGQVSTCLHHHFTGCAMVEAGRDLPCLTDDNRTLGVPEYTGVEWTCRDNANATWDEVLQNW